jgi:hypothetical protein
MSMIRCGGSSRQGAEPIVIDLDVELKALTFLVPRARVRPNAR